MATKSSKTLAFLEYQAFMNMHTKKIRKHSAVYIVLIQN